MSKHAAEFDKLIVFLLRVPPIADCRTLAEISLGSGRFENYNSWIKFSINITHPLAWSAVQEFGHVLNYVSLEERLPTVFMPVSPSP